jgi:poly-beta-1,6-N-acetyl-D-glucosamine synthase
VNLDWPYLAAMVFLGTYPVLLSLLWIAGSAAFSFFREGGRADERFYELDRLPRVSVLIAAFDEELTIGRTLEAVMALDWPDLEVVVVDDGSTDRTADIVAHYAEDPRVELVVRERNQGKAAALNEGLRHLTSDYVLMMDADGAPAHDALRWMVPHLTRLAHVAAVTGNPRVANTRTLLCRMQAVEFSATVSVLRRAQTTWGRLMTFSGICTLARRDALRGVGGFQPEMATEDISMTWQLQAAGWHVRYEPRAVFAMQVPETLGVWWRQRTRWARGTGQVLRRFGNTPVSWRHRRLAAVWLEATLSAFWAHLFIGMTLLWTALLPWGEDVGANPLVKYWGMVIAIVGVAQAVVGMWLDLRYDHRIWRAALWLPLFPLLYWFLLAAAAVRGTIPGVIRRPTGPVTWHVPRTRPQDT